MLLKAAIVLGLATCTRLASAQFAVEPPNTPPDQGLYDEWPGGAAQPTLIRARVGPALRIAGAGATGGLASALDLGRHSGLRVSGTWTAVGQQSGVSQYGAELWLDLGGQHRLRPILAAGAAFVRAHGGAVDEDQRFGAATVRASVDYALALSGADARLGAEAVAAVPAIEAHGNDPWLTLIANLALGF